MFRVNLNRCIDEGLINTFYGFKENLLIIMKKSSIIISLLILSVIVLIQLIPIDKTIPQADPASDFIVAKNPPRKITAMLRASCYDCHSYKTEYPCYSNIAPISWIVQLHIREGRKQLNLSEFGNYSREQRNFLMTDMKNTIEERKMPLKSYTLIHSDAKLDEGMRQNIVIWLTRGKNAIEEP